MATIDEIKKNAQAVKNATQVGENTATRVGGVLVDLASALDTKIDKSSIAQELGDSQDKVVSQYALPFREIDNPEFLHVVVDAEDHFLFGIQQDGSVEWAKGIPAPIREKLNDVVNQAATDKTDLSTKIDELNVSMQIALDTKVDKEEGKSLIDDEVKQHFEVIENDEWLTAMVDAENHLLFGIKRDTGKPYFPLNEMYHVEQNEEFFALWLDAESHILMGIRRDGQIIGEIHAVTALKEVVSSLQSDVDNLKETISAIDSSLQELLNVFSIQENPEYLAMETDAEGRILASTNADGSHYIHDVKSETIPEEFSHIEDPEGRMTIETDAEQKILAYRDKEGVKHEHKFQVDEFVDGHGDKINFATKEDVENKKINAYDINISELNGVVDYSLENLFDPNKIRSYNSDFADKVYAVIGRKTAETGCYSNNIPCKEGDWFSRNDFGTGIVVALDKEENILGDIKDVAYKPTFQVKASDGQDFTNIAYIVLVVMNANIDKQRIVKARYVPTKTEDAIRIPRLKVDNDNIEMGITQYIKSKNGLYYKLIIDDSGDTPSLGIEKLDGVITPYDFPKFSITGDFSNYYKSLILCPIDGGEEPYLFELGNNGIVKRYIKKKINNPRIITENNVLYYYGVDGDLNSNNGKLNIYKAKDDSFELVKGDITTSYGAGLEAHDCLILSVNPLHVITQRYEMNQVTVVDGEEKQVTSLSVEEQYDGKQVWIWKSIDYPELWKDSHVTSRDKDYLHNNTICLNKDGNLCLNNKHANQILVIERKWDEDSHTGSIGEILWKIGGNKSNTSAYYVSNRIQTTTDEQWSESHDAVVDSSGLWTMFDNINTASLSVPSRILEFNVDYTNKKLINFKSYTFKTYHGRYMGSVEKISDGIFLVSWGSVRNTGTPNIGIYDFINNKAIFELSFNDVAFNNYRVYGIK